MNPPPLPSLSTPLILPLQLGLGTEFRSEKIPRNRLRMVSVIPRKKVLIPKHSEFRGRANSEAQNGTELAHKWSRQSIYTELLRRHQSDSSQDILWTAKLGKEGSGKGKRFSVRTGCQWRLLPISLPYLTTDNNRKNNEYKYEYN